MKKKLKVRRGKKKKRASFMVSCARKDSSTVPSYASAAVLLRGCPPTRRASGIASGKPIPGSLARIDISQCSAMQVLASSVKSRTVCQPIIGPSCSSFAGLGIGCGERHNHRMHRATLPGQGSVCLSTPARCVVLLERAGEHNSGQNRSGRPKKLTLGKHVSRPNKTRLAPILLSGASLAGNR